MRVFTSSVITGLESKREVAARVVEDLRHEVVRAEDFGAVASSPRRACLAGVREADVIILLLGERYGEAQPSGLSATHEEYREARGRRPVLAFVQEQVEYEAAQAEFIDEVREWQTGSLAAGFTTEDELRSAVTRSLHEYVVSTVASSVDMGDLLARAEQGAEPPEDHDGEPQLVLSLSPGPQQEVVRPSVLESQSFGRELQKEALFGAFAPLSVEAGAKHGILGDRLVVSQEGASIAVSSTGDIVVRQPAAAAGGLLEFRVLIEEDIRQNLMVGMSFSAGLFDRIDPVGRLSHIAIVASLTGVSLRAWCTRGERALGSNTGRFGLLQDRVKTHLEPPVRIRAEVGQRADELATDLMVLLRREMGQ